MNLARYCLTHAEAPPTRVALEVAGPGGAVLESWTYGELNGAILSVAEGLRASGLGRGDRILLRIGHSSTFPIVFFGAIAGGFVPVPTSAQLTSREAGLILADSGARLIVHDGNTVLPEASGIRLIGPEDTASMLRGALGAFAGTAPDDPAFLIYTSGTSGRPKGVLHAQRAAAARAPMYQGWYGLSANDRFLHAGAFNWTYTLGAGLMDPWANGATSVVYDGPRDPHLWPGIISDTRATLFAAVPSLYRRILKYGALSPKSFPRLRHGLTAGEALPAPLYEAWKVATGRELFEALGMSEISTYVSSGPHVPVKPGSPGKPQEGRKVAVLAENASDATPAEPDQAGLLAVHCSEPGLMLRYWNRPEETEAAFRAGWFLTGDRARQDRDGYLWYEGRADDVMNAFGYRVAPEEVERAITAHPSVSEVAVTALPQAAGISLVTAFVVPVDVGSFDTGQLRGFLTDRLADYKRPKAIRVVESLPRTPSGKIMRKALLTIE